MEQRGAELVGLRSDEAVEFIEALVGQPICIRAGFVGILTGDVVILAYSGSGKTIALQESASGGIISS